MRTCKSLSAGCGVLIICLIVLVMSSLIQGSDYKVKPEITLPEYRTDTGRAIDAYERVMDRFMSMTERNFTEIGTDVKGIAKQLVSIDINLKSLSTRMMRIEKALGIDQAEKRAAKPPKGKPRRQRK